MSERCENCRYFGKREPNAVRGECHRYPPALNTHGGRFWPVVDPDDWCGEWRAAETAKVCPDPNCPDEMRGPCKWLGCPLREQP